MEFLKVLESIRSPFLDDVIGLITRLGEETVAIVVICAIFWCISKKMAYSIGIVYFISGLTAQGMKVIFRVDRPWIIDPTLNPVESSIEHATGYSFPSGHTQAATALFGSLGVQVKKQWLRWSCFAIVLLVGFSRMYLGVHTPQDVIMSLIICVVLIILVHFFYNQDTAGRRLDLAVSLIIMLFAIAAATISVVLFSQGKITENYISDCLKAAGAGAGFAIGMYIEKTYVKFSVKTKSIVMQIIKFVIGFAGVMLIKEGMKLVLGTGLVIDTIRYFLMIIWAIALYPMIIKRFFTKGTQVE